MAVFSVAVINRNVEKGGKKVTVTISEVCLDKVCVGWGHNLMVVESDTATEACLDEVCVSWGAQLHGSIVLDSVKGSHLLWVIGKQ